MGEIFDSDHLRVYSDIEGAIGRTPLVRINRSTSDFTCEIFAKMEMMNPGGSVKDRIAFSIIDAYEHSGELQPGGTVVEATSGNTGVGLAIACAIRGYKSVFVLPDKMSQEKVSMLRAFGAKVVVTPTAVEPEDPRSYYSVAARIVKETPNAVLANQYHNPANPQSHYTSTAPEIWEQTHGSVTDIICGMGTGGTITGIARYVRDHGLDVKIVGVDPEGSILFDAWKRDGQAEGLDATSYLVEGIGEDFIPSTLDLSLIDEVIQVSDAESFSWTRRLVLEEGIFCGGSCGAAMAGAAKYARDLGSERKVVVILPDSGSRYLSKVFNNDWMREHGFPTGEMEAATIADVHAAKASMDLVTAHQADPLNRVIERMREYAVSQLPVLDDEGKCLGIVSEVDLLDYLIKAPGVAHDQLSLRDVALRKVPIVTTDQDFSKALPALTREKVAIVVDESELTVGILTIIDALDWIAQRGAG